MKIEQCGAPSRPYQPQGPVTICYELIDQIEKVARQGRPEVATNDDRRRVHPGRGLRGRARDVRHPADPGLGARRRRSRPLALVMLQFGEDLALRTIRGTTAFFLASKKTWTGSAFADANSPEEQRYYNYPVSPLAVRPYRLIF